MRISGRVLIVAGSDSGGGAGIQADIKTVTALGGFAMTAVTALTAQNTEGVFGIHPVPPPFIRQQMRLVLGDLGADCVKLGMLHNAEVIEAVAEVLAGEAAGLPVVADPVMIAKGGAALLEPAAVDAYRRLIVPRATLLTPNTPEAEALSGIPIRSIQDMRDAAARMVGGGFGPVLLTGGHMDGPLVETLLATADGVVTIANPRIDTPHTHGTGCTVASAVATGIAQGLSLEAAARRAVAYVAEAIRTAPGLGRGHGPLNHAHTVAPFDRRA